MSASPEPHLPGRACHAFVDGLRRLPIEPDRIPDFERLSEVLMRHTGWQVVAVPGLVPDDVFFAHLAQRRFPAGQFIRRADQSGPAAAGIRTCDGCPPPRSPCPVGR